MTDPKTRRPEFWRNLGWTFAGVMALNIVGGMALVAPGSSSGWVNVALGLIFVPQTVIYIRRYRRAKRALENGTEP